MCMMMDLSTLTVQGRTGHPGPVLGDEPLGLTIYMKYPVFLFTVKVLVLFVPQLIFDLRGQNNIDQLYITECVLSKSVMVRLLTNKSLLTNDRRLYLCVPPIHPPFLWSLRVLKLP